MQKISDKPTPEELSEPKISHLSELEEIRMLRHELQNINQRYDLIMEGSHGAIWDWDVPNDRVHFSSRWKKIRGYEEHEISDSLEEWSSRIHPDDYQGVMDAVQAHFDGKPDTYNEKYRILCKDGTWKWIIDRGKALRNSEGRVVRMAGSEVDITEHYKAEQLNKLNEARLESLLRINLHPTKNINELLEFVLNEAIALTQSKIGYIFFYHEDKKELVLSVWSKDVLPQCNVAENKEIYPLENTGIWGEAVRQGKPIILNDFKAPHPLKKGFPEGHISIHSLLTIPIFSQGHIVAVVGVANKRDEYNDSDVRQLNLMMDSVWKVVERRKGKEEKEQLKIQLARAQKMESMGRLAAGVAHDFNNMLMVILGYTEIIISNMNPSEPIWNDIRDDIVEIKNAANRSVEIVRHLLAFARQQKIQPKVLDLNDSVNDIIKILKRLIGEAISLKFAPVKGLWKVNMDSSQIDQILANLCVNAKDAIAGVGKVAIELDMITFDKAWCESHPDFMEGEYVLLSVSDNGCGMDSSTLNLIFDPFFTTKEYGKGTGLGLATVYGIVKQNNGFIHVLSKIGKGTTFNIYLPRYNEPSEELSVECVEISPERGCGTILFVEDEKALLNLGRIMLEKIGYKVITFSMATEAIKFAVNFDGEIDLLITDVVMPKMSGKELSEQLHIIYPKLKTLFISGYSSNSISRQEVIDGSVQLLQKPFSINELALKIQEILGNNGIKATLPPQRNSSNDYQSKP